MQWDRMALWSINDRLGGGEGLDLEKPDFDAVLEDAREIAAAEDRAIGVK